MSDVAPDEVNAPLLRASLRGLALFEGVDDETIEQLVSGIRLRRLVTGETLFVEGEPPDGMAVVLAGRLWLTRLDGSGRERQLADLGRGEVVGEMGMLSDRPRSATATAARDTVVGLLSARLVREVVLQRPDSLLSLARTLVDRVALGERRRWSPVRTIAVLPGGSSSPDVARDLVHALADALGRHGSTAVLTSTDAADATGEDMTADSVEAVAPVLRRWVDEIEHGHDHVLLDGTDASAWTEWSMRFADAILVVVSGNPSAPGPVERQVWMNEGSAHHVELVVVHDPSTTRPGGTRDWLASRHPAGQHHVRRGNQRDHARLARLVTGRGVGLVLGGGGPRGFAHLGVMRALDELGIPVDFVGGTSIGAIMGGYLARGLDHEQRMRVAVSGFTRPDLVRYTLPLVSLSSARQVTAGLRDEQQFGDMMIEDLWLRYLCVSVDLVTGDEVVHERGPLWLATRASSSLPAVFPPVVDGDRLLTDGGILNNIPVDHVAERLSGGRLIAVDLEHAAESSAATTPIPPDVSGWSVLRDRLAPWRPTPNVPGPIETLLRARSIVAARVQQGVSATTPPDVVVKPRLGQHGFVDFRTAPRFVDAGYQAAVEALEEASFSTL